MKAEKELYQERTFYQMLKNNTVNEFLEENGINKEIAEEVSKMIYEMEDEIKNSLTQAYITEIIISHPKITHPYKLNLKGFGSLLDGYSICKITFKKGKQKIEIKPPTPKIIL